MGRGASGRKLTAKRPAADIGGATAAADLATRPKARAKCFLPSGPRHPTTLWEPLYARPAKKKPKPSRVTDKVHVVEHADSPCSSIEREKMDKRLQRFGSDSTGSTRATAAAGVAPASGSSSSGSQQAAASGATAAATAASDTAAKRAALEAVFLARSETRHEEDCVCAILVSELVSQTRHQLITHMFVAVFICVHSVICCVAPFDLYVCYLCVCFWHTQICGF